MADEVERQLGVADQEILDRIWRECARAAPGLTADELVLLVRRSAPKVRAKSNQSVHGLLLTDLVRAAGTPRVMQQIRQYLAEGAPQRQSEETCVVPELFRRDEPSGSAWSRIQQQLCGILSADAMENWFAPCRTLSDEDGVLTIACRDEATVECMTIDNAVAITRAVVKLGLDTCIAFVVPAG